MDIKGILKSMMKDSVDGSVSSKRVITTVAMILCSVAFLANLFGDWTIDEFIYSSMMYIVIAGFGSTVVEKFAIKTQPPQSSDKTVE